MVANSGGVFLSGFVIGVVFAVILYIFWSAGLDFKSQVAKKSITPVPKDGRIPKKAIEMIPSSHFVDLEPEFENTVGDPLLRIDRERI